MMILCQQVNTSEFKFAGDYGSILNYGGKWRQRPIFSIVFCCTALIQKTKSHYTPEAESAMVLSYFHLCIVVTGFMPRKPRFVSGVKRHVSEMNN